MKIHHPLWNLLTEQGFVSIENIAFESDSDYGYRLLEFRNQWIRGQKQFEISSSGTTGSPSLHLLHREAMEKSALATGAFFALQEGDKALLCINTQYIGGIMMMVRSLVLGLELYIVPAQSDPFVHLPDDLTLDFAALVPMQAEIVADNQNEYTRHFLHCKGVIVGGAPISPLVFSKIKKLQYPVYQTFGMTETVSHIALRRISGEQEEKAYTLVPGVEMEVDDRSCLRLKAAVTQHEWLQTNDVVQILSPSQFQWVGRADLVINSGGVKIGIEHTERLIGELLEEMGIANKMLLWYLPDDTLGQKSILLIEGKWDKELENRVQTKLKARLPAYFAPREIRYSPGFVYNENGKLQRLDSLGTSIDFE